MPRLEEGQETLMRAGEDARKRAKGEWDRFSNFALRDNVLEVAVGLMYVQQSTRCVLFIEWHQHRSLVQEGGRRLCQGHNFAHHLPSPIHRPKPR